MSTLIVVNGHTTRSGTRTRGMVLSPEANGRLSEGVDEGQGPG